MNKRIFRPSALMFAAASTFLLFGIDVLTQTRNSSELVPAIAFVSSRDYPGDMAISDLFLAIEIYLSDVNGKNIRRLTTNQASDCYPNLSPDGKRIVFESGRLRTKDDPDNLSDLFIMDSNGANQRVLVRGSSATWSLDGKHIAFHASASGKGTFNRTFPGAATSDSDIFILNVDEFLIGEAKPRNLTNDSAMIDEDPDWSPDGKTIIYTRYGVNDSHEDPTTAEVYEINADGKGKPRRLTKNTEEDRAPAWSPDGRRIAFMCKNGGSVFLACVMKADGTSIKVLNTKESLTPSWTPDGKKIIFHRSVGKELGGNEFQLFSVDPSGANEKQLTFEPGLNGFPNPGFVRKSDSQ